MDDIIEFILEILESLVDGFIKRKPDEMPDLLYQENYVIKVKPRSIAARILASLLWIILMGVGILILDGSMWIMAIVFGFVVLLTSLWCIDGLTYQCCVTKDEIFCRSFIFFKKQIAWKDVISVGKIVEANEKAVTIALRGRDHRCLFKVKSTYENAWQLIKSAQAKEIEIKEEQDSILGQNKKVKGSKPKGKSEK